MVTLYTNKKDCCGCTTCESICPTQAISMKPDDEGFLYPAINESLCIECGMCLKVCSFQNGYDTTQNYDESLVYAVKHVSDEIRNKSTSGGMFTLLSDEFLRQNGVIYGVGYDEKMNICHQRAIDEAKRDSFRGSKYVQSDMRQTLKEVGIDLIEGRKVLFTGTPCQVAGVQAYLASKKIKTQDLILCDIVCHGTPSPKMFSEYIALCERTKGKRIVNHIFRSKNKGWHNHVELNVYEDGESDCKSFDSSLFKYMFRSHMVFRPSCHNCKYTNLDRPSDITIADFWEVDKVISDFDDNKGVSLVLLNTKKGRYTFETIKDHIIGHKCNINSCIQPNMKEPTKPSIQRDAFWRDYLNNGFNYVMKEYFGYGLKGNIKRMICKIKNDFFNSFKRSMKRH